MIYARGKEDQWNGNVEQSSNNEAMEYVRWLCKRDVLKRIFTSIILNVTSIKHMVEILIVYLGLENQHHWDINKIFKEKVSVD